MKIACATAVALIAGTASFAAPAAAQRAPMPSSHARISPGHANEKLFIRAVAIYDAGLRRGSANSSRTAYLRGFRDGTSSEAYTAQQYVVNSAPGYSVAPVSGYSLYDSAAVDAATDDGYSRSVAYRDANGYGDGRYDAGYAPRGLMDVVVAPVAVAAAASAEARLAHWNYCTARYQSFDPASDTFLAFDGNRYFCR
jgi:hypothetical protein